jgi:fructokinase
VRVVAAGYMPIDVVYQSKEHFFRSIGGTAANVAMILAYFGCDALLAGQIGDDVVADEFEREAHAAGVSTALLARAPGAETARLIHRVQPDGHSYAYTCPACHQRFPRSRPLTLDLARQVIATEPDVDVFFFDRVNAATVRLAEHYSGVGSLVMFEPSLSTGGDLFRRAADAADIIKHSGEIDLPIPENPPSKRPEQVRIVTHGAAGLTYRVGAGASRRLPAIPTLTVDTAGAGDWTTAAVLHHVGGSDGLDHDDLEKGLRLGQALAAMCCALVGARTLAGLPASSVLALAREVLEANKLDVAPSAPDAPRKRKKKAHCGVCALPESTSG